DHDPRQHAPRAQAIAEPAGRHLEQPVRHRERHRHIAQLRVRQLQFDLNWFERLGHADSVEVQHGGHAAQPEDHYKPNAGGLGGRWNVQGRLSLTGCPGGIPVASYDRPTFRLPLTRELPVPAAESPSSVQSTLAVPGPAPANDHAALPTVVTGG